MNINGIVKQIKKINAKERREIKNKIELAKEELERLKRDFLAIDRNLDRMILFGSLATGNVNSLNFDIDIAVKSEKYYQLVSNAMESEFKVDVVNLEKAHKNIKKRIIEEGIVIYEKRAG